MQEIGGGARRSRRGSASGSTRSSPARRPKGTLVRICDAADRRACSCAAQGLDVGDRVRVKLVRTDVDKRLHRLRARLNHESPQDTEEQSIALSAHSLNRRPTIAFTIQCSLVLVKPCPTPKLNSQSGDTFRSSAGKSR